MTDNCSSHEIHGQVNRILESRGFVRSKFLCVFLRYIVEQHLSGNHELLKEHSLGKAVFAREDGYKPSSDPIVRVQARRMRAKLDAYYAAEGRTDPILITVPKGSYTPVLIRRSSSQHIREASFHVAEEQAAC